MTAASIIILDRRILLVKRVEHASLFSGCWAFPGGKAEDGETPRQTAIRETKEEVNLDFEPRKLFVTHPYKDRVMHRFLGDWSGQIRLQESELCDYGWFTYRETGGLHFAFDYREVVNRLFAEGYIE